MSFGSSCGGFAGGFSLVVVLFILLFIVGAAKYCCDRHAWNLAYKEENGKLENYWYEWISGIWLPLIMRRYVNLTYILYTFKIEFK